jgi:hypothetical protein
MNSLHQPARQSVILVLDDAQCLLQGLPAMQTAPDVTTPASAGAGSPPRHWVVLACPPRMSQRIGKFMSQSARAGWQARWIDKLRAQIQPVLQEGRDTMELHILGNQFAAQLKTLQSVHPGADVKDLRRPRIGEAPATQSVAKGLARGALPGGLLMLVLALSLTPD